MRYRNSTIAKCAASALLAALGAWALVWAIHPAGNHSRIWRQLGALFEAVGGLLGVAFLGLCVAGLLFLADSFMGDEDGKPEQQDRTDS